MTDEVRFTQDYIVYNRKEQGLFPVAESDWERIKRNIGQIIPVRKIFQVLGSVCLGMAGTSLVAIVTVANGASDVAAWMFPTLWAILAGSFVVGIALFVLDHEQKAIATSSSKSVVEEMESLERGYEQARADKSGQRDDESGHREGKAGQRAGEHQRLSVALALLRRIHSRLSGLQSYAANELGKSIQGIDTGRIDEAIEHRSRRRDALRSSKTKLDRDRERILGEIETTVLELEQLDIHIRA